MVWTNLILVMSAVLGGGAEPQTKGDDFEAKILISPDLYFHDQWAFLPPNVGPQLLTFDRVERRQFFAVYFLFRNYAVSKEQECKVDFDLSIDRPDGKKYFDEKGLSAYAGKKERKEELILWNHDLRIAFEPNDPPGEYVVNLKAYDRMGRTSSTVRETIRLVEEFPSEDFKDLDTLNHWLTNYYRKPDPSRLAAAFRSSVKFECWKKDRAPEMLCSFFAAAFRDQATLLKQMVKTRNSFDAETRKALFFLLAKGGVDEKLYAESMDAASIEEIAKFKKETPFDPEKDKIAEPYHLDMLWYRFLATGQPQPVFRICQVFETRPDGLDEKGTKGLTSEVLVYKAASWSLHSNMKQHSQVRQYVVAAAQRRELNPNALVVLAALLKLTGNSGEQNK